MSRKLARGLPLVAAALAAAASMGCVAIAHRGNAGSLGDPVRRVVVKTGERNAPQHLLTHPPAAPVARPDSLKVHAVLRRAIALHPGGSDTVLVTFVDPLLQDDAFMGNITGSFQPGSPKDTLSRQNRLARISDSLTTRRATFYAQEADTLAQRYGATVLPQRFKLAQSLGAVMPFAQIYPLAASPSVLRIDPLRGDPAPSVPPCGTGATDYMSYAKTVIGSTAYLDAGYGSGQIALLDTGVWRDHCLLSGASCAPFAGQQAQPSTTTPMESPIATVMDCVPVSCADDMRRNSDAASQGHGTGTAAVLSGTNALGVCHQGVTIAALDCYDVYFPATDARGDSLGIFAAEAAFDQAVLVDGHDLIAAEMALYGGDGGLTAQANMAYRLDAAVIAAAGNYGISNAAELPEPADAPLALAIGSYTLPSLAYQSTMMHGSTTDGRQKPEVGGPTGALTASVPYPFGPTADPTTMEHHTATSGATPFVVGAALLLKNWMLTAGDPVSAGDLYAMLLLCGRNRSAQPTDGTGLIQMPNEGYLWWNHVTVKNGKTKKVQIKLEGAPAKRYDAAIWWPEDPRTGTGYPVASEQSNIVLELEASGQQAMSPSTRGVFRRVMLDNTTTNTHRFEIRMTGSSIPSGEQTVYYAVWARP